MDEIFIEEKKYISSKQAAKVTGYAKDYIGQLCREGRVPARLVGRNWYVLETAIQDHRFGDSEMEQGDTEKGEEAISEIPEPVNPAASGIQESWQAWFDRVDTAVEKPTESVESEKMEIEVVEDSPIEQETIAEEESEPEKPVVDSIEATVVPIRTITAEPKAYSIPEDLLPRNNTESPLVVGRARTVRKIGKRHALTFLRAIEITGAVFATISLVVAALGTGYFDHYVLSNSQASVLSGVSLYNKALK